MKFKELPKKWKWTITILMFSTILLLFTLILYVWSTLGSLINVMFG